MKIIVLICLFFALAVFANTKDDFVLSQFNAFKLKFAKNYKSDDEEQMRFKIFKQNLKKIVQMNLNSQGQNNFGITKFSDLTPSEFSHMYLMPNRPLPDMSVEKYKKINYTGVSIPTEWDWRKDGLRNGVSAITAVYNQGQCGSCWAFSATEQTESMEFLQGNAGAQPNHLSMQQVVDCDTKAYGCDGGWTTVAYDYIKSCGGYDSLASYPYTAEDGTCHFTPANVQAKISDWHYVTILRDEKEMKNYVGTAGPISICVDASSWQFYNGGVLKTCGTSIDHCVQLVGYTTSNGVEAWIVRNSWGTSWGLQGYILLEYGKDMCAMAHIPTSVVTAKA